VINKKDKNETRKKIHIRSRQRINGTSERPRLNIYRSLKNMYAQIINDETGETLASASTMEKELVTGLKSGGNVDAAKAVGKAIAQRAIEKGISQVVFDRGGFLYHGKIKELAEAAREAGLQF
jgi:large subunit ribosomal protein L18